MNAPPTAQAGGSPGTSPTSNALRRRSSRRGIPSRRGSGRFEDLLPRPRTRGRGRGRRSSKITNLGSQISDFTAPLPNPLPGVPGRGSSRSSRRAFTLVSPPVTLQGSFFANPEWIIVSQQSVRAVVSVLGKDQKGVVAQFA